MCSGLEFAMRIAHTFAVNCLEFGDFRRLGQVRAGFGFGLRMAMAAALFAVLMWLDPVAGRVPSPIYRCRNGQESGRSKRASLDPLSAIDPFRPADAWMSGDGQSYLCRAMRQRRPGIPVCGGCMAARAGRLVSPADGGVISTRANTASFC